MYICMRLTNKIRDMKEIIVKNAAAKIEEIKEVVNKEYPGATVSVDGDNVVITGEDKQICWANTWSVLLWKGYEVVK